MAAGRHCNPGAAHVGENVGESNKSIPGYRWYPLENAGKLIPKYNGAPLSRSLFFLRPSRDRILSTLPLPARVPRERAEPENDPGTWLGFSRGNTARRSNDYTLHHLSLPISIHFYTRGPGSRGS